MNEENYIVERLGRGTIKYVESGQEYTIYTDLLTDPPRTLIYPKSVRRILKDGTLVAVDDAIQIRVIANTCKALQAKGHLFEMA